MGDLPSLWVFLEAIADRKRLKIVEYLANHGETTVSDVGRHLRISQPLMSWHLRMLRRARVVKTVRAGRHVYCSLDRSAVREYQAALSHLVEPKAAQKAEEKDLEEQILQPVT